MDDSLAYLLNFLEDEFRAEHRVKVRVSPKAVHQKSMDLEPNPDPPPLPTRGVYVRAKTREYFFPADWIREKRYQEVDHLIREIQEFLSSS